MDHIEWLRSKLTPEEILQLTAGPPAGPLTPEPSPDLTVVAGVSHEYSTIDPWNLDHSALLLWHPGGAVGLHFGDGAFHQMLPRVNHSSEPRWSRTERNVFYFVEGNSLLRFDVGKDWTTDAISTVRTFSEYLPFDPGERNGVRNRGEGDISDDGRYLALSGLLPGGLTEVFRFNLETRSVGRRAKLTDFDQVYITPDNNVLVGYLARGNGRFQGLELFDGDMQFIRQITTAIGHMDVGRDIDGAECVVWCNSNQLNDPICENGIVLVPLAHPERARCLLSLDWSLAVHISCPAVEDWCIVTSYDPKDPFSAIGDANEILKVGYDGLIDSLGKHGADTAQQEHQPKASVSHDGSRVIYDVNGNAVIHTL